MFFTFMVPRVEPARISDYKSISRESGIPFDELLMVDVVKNNNADYEVTEKGLKEAALDFYVLKVKVYEKEYDPTPTPAPSVTPKPHVPTYDWVYKQTEIYEGSEEILSFLKSNGFSAIINSSFAKIGKSISSLHSSARYDIAIHKKKYDELISGYNEDIVKWAKDMIENDVIKNLYK